MRYVKQIDSGSARRDRTADKAEQISVNSALTVALAVLQVSANVVPDAVAPS